MQDAIIRPTTKFIRAGFAAAAIVVAALEILYFTQARPGAPIWVGLVPLLILSWPLSRLLRQRFITITISGGRLRYEVGLAARSTRTIQISKIQDIRVDQSVMQRMFGVGDLSIETAGEASRLTLHNIDQPQALADRLMDLAQHEQHPV